MVILSLGEIATTFSWLGIPEVNDGIELWRFGKRKGSWGQAQRGLRGGRPVAGVGRSDGG